MNAFKRLAAVAALGLLAVTCIAASESARGRESGAKAEADGETAGQAMIRFGLPRVHLNDAIKKTVRATVELAGEAAARRRAAVPAEVPGRVAEMRFEEGDRVAAGEVLCRLRTKPVELQLARVRAELEAARAELAKLEKGYRSEEISQARARLASAKATLDRWELEFDRTRRLLAEGASTEAEMEQVRASYRQAQEAVAEAKAHLELLEAGFREEEIARAGSNVAAMEARVGELEDTLDRMVVRMPFDGYVVAKGTELGEWLRTGQTVARVVDLAVVRVELDMPERYGGNVAAGDEASVLFEAIPDGRLTGRVSQVVPLSGASTHTMMVRVDVANPIIAGRPHIPSGMFARVELAVGREHEALLVHKDALIRQEGRDLVYTVAKAPPANTEVRPRPKPTTEQQKREAEMVEASNEIIVKLSRQAGVEPGDIRFAIAVPVKILGGHGEWMAVEGPGLEAGTPVVTRGAYMLKHGTAVELAPPERPDGSGIRTESPATGEPKAGTEGVKDDAPSAGAPRDAARRGAGE